MRKLFLWLAFAALALSGCSVGHTEYSRTVMQHVNMSFTGMSFISAMPVESSGSNLARTAIRNGWNKNPCMAMASNAGVVKGMSGGAVCNANNTPGGVIAGFSDEIQSSSKIVLKDVSLYIPCSDFQNWLKQNIGQTAQSGA